VVELVVLRTQTGLDVAQALAVGELGKSHAPEGMLGKMIQHLGEDEFACIHAPLPCARESAREVGAKGDACSSRQQA